ncbi:MAG: DUF3386 family protein [Planctomycetota bacterium]
MKLPDLSLARGASRLLTLVAAVLVSSVAHAHFIWIHIHPDQPQRVEILFGDGVYQDSEASLVRYIEGLALHTADGAQVELTTMPWGLAGQLPAGTELLYGSHDMGLFQRPGMDTSVKLDYDSKAALNVAAAGQRTGQPLELVLAEDGAELIVTVLLNGEPAAGATVRHPRPGGGDPIERETAADGTLRIARPAAGLLSLRAKHVIDEPGEHEGEPFTGRHRYAMLTVSSVRTAPLPKGGSVDAWQRLSDALLHERQLPADVGGLAGVVLVHLGGEPVRGEFELNGGEWVECSLPGLSKADEAWVGAHLRQVIETRLARDLATTTGAHALALAPRDGSPLGRLVVANDPGQTRYYLHDHRVQLVERTEDGIRRSSAVLAHEEGEDGRVLPLQTFATEVDTESGQLLASEAITDEYREADGRMLPAKRRVLRTSGRVTRALLLELRNLELLEAPGATEASHSRD